MKKKLIIISVVFFVVIVTLLVFSQNNKRSPSSTNPTTSDTSNGPKVDSLGDVQFTQNSLGISADGYKITSVTYFEGNTWALAVVEPSAYQAQASKMILSYDAASQKWLQISDPVEVFSADIQTKIPAGLYSYLVDQNMILNHSETQ